MGATENQAWMYGLTPAQQRIRNQQLGENSTRLAGDFLQESIRENAAAGGLPWDPTGGGGRGGTTTSGGGGGGRAPYIDPFTARMLTRRGGGGGFSGGGFKLPGTPTLNFSNASDGKNVAQLRAMYASALAELQRQQAEGGQTVLRSVDRMRNDPMNNANAYARLQAVAPNVAGDPLAQYAEATGISPDMANKGQQLANADAQAYQNAVQNVYDIMSTSQQAANDTRMNDIGMIETGANQDLVSQANMLKLLLNQREMADVITLRQKNLENSLAQRNAITQQIQSIFGKDGQMGRFGARMNPASIFELIESTLAKMNTSSWEDGQTA